jgi:hypothetical protein
MDITPPGGFKIIWNDIVVMMVAIKPKLALISFIHLPLSSLDGDKHFHVRFTNFLKTFFFGFFGVWNFCPLGRMIQMQIAANGREFNAALKQVMFKDLICMPLKHAI